jgi:hypothetical protein
MRLSLLPTLILLTTATSTTLPTQTPPTLYKRQDAQFDLSINLGQTRSEMIGLTTTFIPGYPPANPTGSIFLWPGFFDQYNRIFGDLVQTVVEGHSWADNKLTCGAVEGQWYVFPFYLEV